MQHVGRMHVSHPSEELRNTRAWGVHGSAAECSTAVQEPVRCLHRYVLQLILQ